MSTNGEGAPQNGQGARPTFEEALAAMPARDRVDRLAIFTAEHCETLRRLIEAQGNAVAGVFELVRSHLKLIDGEVTALRGEVMRLKAEHDEGNGAGSREIRQ